MSDAFKLRLQAALGSTYVLERELRGGGMSRVFLGRDTMLGRQVVLKVVSPETATHEPGTRFRHEAILAARLQHPHIVPVFGIGQVEDIQYFTMPYIDGESLRARLERRRALPAAEVRRVLREIGSALACAHRHGIVHRDVKPENIFIERTTERTLLADFGVALALGEPDGATSSGVTVGTPAYMSPEQVDGGRVNGLSDIYSLGLVGWEMLTGERPWPGDSLYDVMYKQKHESLPPLDSFDIDVPPSLAAAIERALHKDPRSRWPTAEAFVAAADPDAATIPALAVSDTVATDMGATDLDAGFDEDRDDAAFAPTDADDPTIVARVRRSTGNADAGRTSPGWRTAFDEMPRSGRWSEPRQPRVLLITTLILLAAAAVGGAATVGRRFLPAPFSTTADIATPPSTTVAESPAPPVDTVPTTDVAAGLATIESDTRPKPIAADAPPLAAAPAQLATVPVVHVARHARRVYPDARSGTSVRARVATAELELHSYEHVMATAPALSRPTQPGLVPDRASPPVPSTPSAAPPLAPAVPSPTSEPPSSVAPAHESPEPHSASSTTASASPSAAPDAPVTRASAVRVTHNAPATTTADAAPTSCRPSFPGSHVCRVYDERTGRIVEYQYIPNGAPASSP